MEFKRDRLAGLIGGLFAFCHDSTEQEAQGHVQPLASDRGLIRDFIASRLQS